MVLRSTRVVLARLDGIPPILHLACGCHKKKRGGKGPAENGKDKTMIELNEAGFTIRKTFENRLEDSFITTEESVVVKDGVVEHVWSPEEYEEDVGEGYGHARFDPVIKSREDLLLFLKRKLDKVQTRADSLQKVLALCEAAPNFTTRTVEPR